LRELSRRQGVTLYMTLLAALKTLLARYTGREDIAVGTDIANRNRTETEGLIGFFVNQLVMRTDLSGDPSFTELLARVREMTLGAYAHQDLPFETLVHELQPERELGRSPLFQIKFVLQNARMQTLELPGLTITPVGVARETTPLDFVLAVTETADGLAATATYATELYDETTVRRLLRRFETLLGEVVKNPGARLSELRLVEEEAAGGVAATDFPDAGLSQQEFENLLLELAEG
jgi:non-ribosomal peptide synthetase component F